MDFANPEILYALLLIPVFVGLFILARVARRRKLARFGRPEVVAALMPEASRYKPAIKITIEMLALAALIVALARPRGGARENSEEIQGIEVMIAFDVSRSMLAPATDDPRSVSRLNRAKLLLNNLVDKLTNDKVGLIVYAGNAYTQLPLTTDFLSAKMFINNLSPDMVSTQGTDIGAAISMALNNFSPDKDVNKAIILITDCEDHENEAIAMAKTARENGVQVDVIGVGTPKGGLIPINANRGEFLKDANGAPVTSVFNPEVAAKIAEAGGGVYVDGSASDAISKVDATLDKIKKSNLGELRYTAGAEKFPIFIWIALVLMVADIFVLDRKIGWLQRINFFTKSTK